MQWWECLFWLHCLLTNFHLSSKEISVLKLCEQERDPSWPKLYMLSWKSTLYLPDRHTAHAWVQHACPSTGTHLAGEREPFPPSDTVGLHWLPVRANQPPASTYVFTIKQRKVLDRRHSSCFLITNNITSPLILASHHCLSVLEITYNILLLILTAFMDQAPKLYNRVVSPIGAWDLWAGPLWSFQSRARRPEFCCRGLLAVERPAWGDEACKVSKFFKSPHETHFYWPRWFKANITAQSIEINLQLHKPRKRKTYLPYLDIKWWPW